MDTTEIDRSAARWFELYGRKHDATHVSSLIPEGTATQPGKALLDWSRHDREPQRPAVETGFIQAIATAEREEACL
jgi:hypothetical protein